MNEILTNTAMKDTYQEENKIRSRKGYKTIKRPFVSIDPTGKGVVNKTACELLGLKPGDRIEWKKGGPVKAESGIKLTPKLRGLQFRSAMLAHLLKVEERKRIYLNLAA